MVREQPPQNVRAAARGGRTQYSQWSVRKGQGPRPESGAQQTPEDLDQELVHGPILGRNQFQSIQYLLGIDMNFGSIQVTTLSRTTHAASPFEGDRE